MTNKVLWWLVALAARALSPDERDCVRGDLEESGATALEALGSVLGLIMRRQAIVWSDWRTWLRLASLIVPLSAVLSIISRRTAEGTAVYFWFYVNNWHWSFINTAGFWSVLAESAWDVSMAYFMLACLSWTGGFVLGTAFRRTPRMNGFLFCSMLLLGASLIAPHYLDFFQERLQASFTQRFYYEHRGIFDLTFYRVIFPVLLQAIVVLLPAVWGMRQARRNIGSPPLLNPMIWVGVMGTALVMLIEVPGLHLLIWIKGGASLATSVAHVVRGLRPLVYWPLAYLIVTAIWRFRGQRLAEV